MKRKYGKGLRKGREHRLQRTRGLVTLRYEQRDQAAPINQAAWKMPDHWCDVSAKTVSKSRRGSTSPSLTEELVRLKVEGYTSLYAPSVNPPHPPRGISWIYEGRNAN